jgi:hypothetical protein
MLYSDILLYWLIAISSNLVVWVVLLLLGLAQLIPGLRTPFTQHLVGGVVGGDVGGLVGGLVGRTVGGDVGGLVGADVGALVGAVVG